MPEEAAALRKALEVLDAGMADEELAAAAYKSVHNRYADDDREADALSGFLAANRRLFVSFIV